MAPDEQNKLMNEQTDRHTNEQVNEWADGDRQTDRVFAFKLRGAVLFTSVKDDI